MNNVIKKILSSAALVIGLQTPATAQTPAPSEILEDIFQVARLVATPASELPQTLETFTQAAGATLGEVQVLKNIPAALSSFGITAEEATYDAMFELRLNGQFFLCDQIGHSRFKNLLAARGEPHQKLSEYDHYFPERPSNDTLLMCSLSFDLEKSQSPTFDLAMNYMQEMAAVFARDYTDNPSTISIKSNTLSPREDYDLTFQGLYIANEGDVRRIPTFKRARLLKLEFSIGELGVERAQFWVRRTPR